MCGAILAVLSMGVLTYKGATAKESLGSENILKVPAWASQQGYAAGSTAYRGAQLFAKLQERRWFDICKDQPHALSRKSLSHCFSDAASGTRNHGNFIR